jgi:hypothetical protein
MNATAREKILAKSRTPIACVITSGGVTNALEIPAAKKIMATYITATEEP